MIFLYNLIMTIDTIVSPAERDLLDSGLLIGIGLEGFEKDLRVLSDAEKIKSTELTDRISRHLEERGSPGAAEYIRVLSKSAILDEQLKMATLGTFDPELIKESGLPIMIDINLTTPEMIAEGKAVMLQEARDDLLGDILSLKNKLDIYFTNTIQLEAEHYTSKYTGKRTIGQKLRALVATDPEPNFVIQRKLDELSTLRYLSREQMKEYVMRELKQFIRQNPSSIGLLTTASASRHLRFISNEIGGLATDPIRIDHLRDLHSYMRGEEGMKELGIYPGYARAVEKSVERDLVHARAEV